MSRKTVYLNLQLYDKNISVPSFYLYLPGWRGTEETMKSPHGFCISFHHGIPNVIFSSLHRTGPNYLISVAGLFSTFFATYWFFFSIPCKMCSIKKLVKQKKKINKTHELPDVSKFKIANGKMVCLSGIFFFFYSSSLPGFPSSFYLHPFPRCYPPALPIIRLPQSGLSLISKIL